MEKNVSFLHSMHHIRFMCWITSRFWPSQGQGAANIRNRGACWCFRRHPACLHVGIKTVRIFSDRIRDRIRLDGFRYVRIRVWIFNIRYRIRIRILKSHIYDVDVQSYHIRHGWHYPYSNPNSTRNIKTNVISVISVRIRSVFIPTYTAMTELLFVSTSLSWFSFL
jgi:hypothetical protein